MPPSVCFFLYTLYLFLRSSALKLQVLLCLHEFKQYFILSYFIPDLFIMVSLLNKSNQFPFHTTVNPTVSYINRLDFDFKTFYLSSVPGHFYCYLGIRVQKVHLHNRNQSFESILVNSYVNKQIRTVESRVSIRYYMLSLLVKDLLSNTPQSILNLLLICM